MPFLEMSPKDADTNINYSSTYTQDVVAAIPEVPPIVDPVRPPQRNDDNKSCHCGCPCAFDAAEAQANDGEDKDAEMFLATREDSVETDSRSLYSDPGIEGDERAQDHLIEIGDFGMHSPASINRTLARQQRGNCYCAAAEDLYLSTPSPTSPSDSMIVESGTSSQNHSMASSQVLSLRSCTSSLFGFMNGGFAQDTILDPITPMLFRPLRLTPYPLELNFSVGDFSEYDMW